MDAERDGSVALPYIEACAELGGDVEGVVADAGCGGDGNGARGFLFLEAGERREVEDELAGVFAGATGLVPGAHDVAGGEGVFAGVYGDAEGGGDFGGGEDHAGVGNLSVSGSWGWGGVAAGEDEGCGEEGED